MGKKYCLFFFLMVSFFLLLAFGAEKIIVDQNLAVIYEKNTSSSSTVIHIFIKGGTASEPEQKKGLAYLTTSLSIGMIDSHTRKQMTEMGSRLTFQIKEDFTVITVTCLSTHLEQTLKIVFKVLANPLFSSFRINRIKNHMKHRQTAEKDSNIRLLGLKQRLIFFSKKSYGSSIYGDSKSVENIKRKDILKFYRDYFVRDNMLIGINSSLEKSRINDILKQLFPLFSPTRKPLPAKQKIKTPKEKKYFFEMDRKQTLIAIVISSPELAPNNFARGFLLENILGKGMGSKLWALREREQLAYFVNADLWQVKNSGILSIYLKTDNQKKDQAYRSLNDILNNLYINGITSEEFKINKGSAKADFLRLVETGGQRIFLRTYFEILELGYQYVDRFTSDMDKIILENFNVFLKKILNPENRITITIGSAVVSSPI